MAVKFKPSLVQMQWLVWVVIYLMLFLSLTAMDGVFQAAVYALLNTAFYAAIIYGNITWLFPRLYQKGRILWYVFSVMAFLLAVGFIRAVLTVNIYNALFAAKPEPMSMKAITSFVLGGITVFFFSFAFRLALAYFTLKEQAAKALAQKASAELDLLKSQVQPHFLFNTLNNIYYEAYMEAPRTAALIERLADVMRYFVDESPKSLVSLNTEVQFIENYIALEKIRIRYALSISFEKQYSPNLSIPPMLLMTFAENVFKHGIDKSSGDNRVSLSLTESNGRLIYNVSNTMPQQEIPGLKSGLGIANLKKRLTILYGNNFELHTSNNGEVFTAALNIPLA